jgi:hypothetical protein
MTLRSSLLGILLISLVGCGKNSVPPSSAWITFDSPDAPYSVLLPEKPKRQEQTASGIKVVMQLCDTNKNLVVITSNNDMPAEVDINNKKQVKDILDVAVTTGMAKQKATIKEQRDLKLQGKYPCREVTATLKAPNGTEGTMRLRLVLIPKMLIQVLLIGDSKDMQMPQIKECLESLKIKK